MPPIKPSTPRIYRRQGAPVAWYLMDAPRRTFPGDSGDVGDLAGRTAAGVRSGGCAFANGSRGRTLSFDGSTGGVAVSSPPMLGTAFSFSCRAVLSSAPDGGYHAIMRYDEGDPNAFALYLWGPTNTFAFYNTAGTVITATTTPVVGTEYHLTGTLDGAHAKLYVNGVLEGSDNGWGRPSFATPSLYLGRYSGGQFFAGTIGDARIYDRVLSPAEIAREYADPNWRLRPTRRAISVASAGSPGNASGAAPALSLSAPSGTATGGASASGVAPALSLSAPAGTATGTPSAPNPSGLLAYYKFDEGSGATLNDSSGHARHGALGAAGAAPTWTAGPTGGLTFPSGTYVDIPSAAWDTAVTIQAVIHAAGSGYRQIIGCASAGLCLLIDAQEALQIYDIGYTSNPTFASEAVTTGPRMVSAVLGSVADKLYVNDHETGYAAQGGNLGSQHLNPQIGGGGRGLAFQGAIYSVLIYDRALSQAEIAANRAAIQYDLSTRGGTAAILTFDGNSLVAGDINPTPSDRFYNKSVALLTQGEVTSNVGVDGNTTPDRIAAFGTAVSPLYSILAPRNAVLLWEIRNDLSGGGASIAAAEAHVDTYAALCTKVGFEFIVGTSLSGSDLDETKRLAVNAHVRANYANVADFGADPTIGATGAYADTTHFLVDGVHLNGAGNAIAAGIYYAALQAMGIEPTPVPGNASGTPPAISLSAPPGSATGTTNLKQAVVAALAGSAALTAIVGSRVYPKVIPQTNGTATAISYRFISAVRARTLRNAAGMKEVRFRFEVEATSEGATESVHEIVRLIFQGMPGVLSGIPIQYCTHENEVDEYYEPIPGSDEGTYSKTFDLTFKVRETVPSR